jgi:general secretion pathway protein G
VTLAAVAGQGKTSVYMPETSPRRPRAFTLIEVLVVIVVIAVLATLVAPDLFRNVNDARVTTAKAQIESFGTALDSYRLDHGRYPTTAQGLGALWQKPVVDPPASWSEPYLRKPVPNDPWGRPYLYVAPGKVNPATYDLLTYGADGQPGGERENADITSWQ